MDAGRPDWIGAFFLGRVDLAPPATFTKRGTDTMDYLWRPWRFQYMAQVTPDKKQPDGIFCDAIRRTDDQETLVVYRGIAVFVILNRFPSPSGHVMIVPYD